MGRRLGNYQVRALIGCGAMGAVYLAQDAVLDRPVALKVLLGSLAKSPEQLRRFQREARAAAPLSHPNIVRIYEAGVREGIPFIAMEYVDGESFDHLLGRAGVIPWRRALEIAGQMALALDCAHEHGVVHRDVKPSNMLIDKSGRLRLTDFGIARVRDQSTGLTEHDLFIGTPEFMSPEQCSGSSDIGPKSDLFSLGVTLYRMISGRMPFAGFNTAALLASITRETPVRLNRILPEVPDDVARLVAHLLEKDPAARPESAEVVAATIDSLLENDGGASAMSAALDAFIRDQAKPRQIEAWNTPTPHEKERAKSVKRGPMIRQKKRRQFYAPVSLLARASAACMLTLACLGAAYWYLAATPTIVLPAPLLDKAVFAAEQRGVYRMSLPAGAWMVRDMAWAPSGESLLVALAGQPGSSLHGAQGIISVSPEDGAIHSVVPPVAPWRDGAVARPEPLQPMLTLLPNRPAGLHPLAAHGYLLRAAAFGGAGEVAILKQPIGGDAPISSAIAVLPHAAWHGAGDAFTASRQAGCAVSPDGSQLALATPLAGEGYDISVRAMDAASTSQALKLNTDPMNLIPESLTFSPDGASLLVYNRMEADTALYRIGTESGGRVERLARGDFRGTLALAPSGAHALASIGSGEFEEVYLVALDGSGAMTRIAQANVEAHAYTPDGRLALLTGRDGGASTLLALNPEQPSALKEVARFEGETASRASISAGGKWAALSLQSPGDSSLAVIDLQAADAVVTAGITPQAVTGT